MAQVHANVVSTQLLRRWIPSHATVLRPLRVLDNNVIQNTEGKFSKHGDFDKAKPDAVEPIRKKHTKFIGRKTKFDCKAPKIRKWK